MIKETYAARSCLYPYEMHLLIDNFNPNYVDSSFKIHPMFVPEGRFDYFIFSTIFGL